MCNALIHTDDVTFRQAAGLIGRIGQEEGTQTRGQVDDDIHTGIPDTVDGFLEQLGVATAVACLGVANVNVHDGGPCLRRFDAGCGDFRRCYRKGWVFAVERSVSGHSAGEYNLSISWVHTNLLAGLHIPAEKPSSMRTVEPCMERASLVARNTAMPAISSAGENVRPLGVRALIAASIGWYSGSVRTPSFIGVAVFPGATAFTLMPCGASSQASARVIDMMP